MSLTKAWRELHRSRFPELPFDCGNEDDPGIIYGPDLRDWSAKATTPDQYRIEKYIDRFDLRDKRLLHIGVGNSGLARRFHRRVKEIVGTTIDEPEIKVAQTLGYPNYSVVLHNKYSGGGDRIAGKFDFILDNNLTSPCCCVRHLAALFTFFGERLSDGGHIVTDREGLAWISSRPVQSAMELRFRGSRGCGFYRRAGGLPGEQKRLCSLAVGAVRSHAWFGLAPHRPARRHAARQNSEKWPAQVCSNLSQGLHKVAGVGAISTATKPGAMTVAGNGRRLPNLFIVGAPKCGTTAWVEYLAHPPGYLLPGGTRIIAISRWICRTSGSPAAKPTMRQLFADSGDARVIGEASAMYLFSEAAAGAIRDHDPASENPHFPARTGRLFALAP